MDGRVAVHLKRPRRGVSRLLFEPVAFIARLAALLPMKNCHQIRYFGVYATATPLRRLVLPEPPEPTRTRPVAPERPARMKHADLLMRSFNLIIDYTQYRRCGTPGAHHPPVPPALGP